MNKDNAYKENLDPVDDWEYFEWALKLETQWKAKLKDSLPKSNVEWLNIFPEAKEIIPEKIHEWELKATSLRRQIRMAIKIIDRKSPKEDRWFWMATLKYVLTPVKDLAIAYKHIERLKWMSRDSKNSKRWSDSVEDAKNKSPVHVAEHYGLKIRKSGNTYVALCPFHIERTPSFHIYPTTCRFVCFGCGEKGDVIAFVMMMDKCSFMEAVNKLRKI